MKKTLFILTVMLTSSLFTNSAKAQDSKILAGAGATYLYLNEEGKVGLSIDGIYLFNDNWEGALAYTHIFKEYSQSLNIYALDAHYVFLNGKKTKTYAIAGVNRTVVKVDSGVLGLDFSMADNGVNLGAGFRYAMSSKLSLNLEMKYTPDVEARRQIKTGLSVLYSF